VVANKSTRTIQQKTAQKVYILPVPVQLGSYEAGALLVLLPDDPDCMSHILYISKCSA
jgi:hypothetical protein